MPKIRSANELTQKEVGVFLQNFSASDFQRVGNRHQLTGTDFSISHREYLKRAKTERTIREQNFVDFALKTGKAPDEAHAKLMAKKYFTRDMKGLRAKYRKNGALLKDELNISNESVENILEGES